jgi:hypothetical protein
MDKIKKESFHYRSQNKFLVGVSLPLSVEFAGLSSTER